MRSIRLLLSGLFSRWALEVHPNGRAWMAAGQYDQFMIVPRGWVPPERLLEDDALNMQRRGRRW